MTPEKRHELFMQDLFELIDRHLENPILSENSARGFSQIILTYQREIFSAKKDFEAGLVNIYFPRKKIGKTKSEKERLVN